MSREKKPVAMLKSLHTKLVLRGALVLVLTTFFMKPAVRSAILQQRTGQPSGSSATGFARRGAPSLAAIRVSFRLDPWLLSGNYGSGFWVSPPVFGPAAQPGNTFAIQVRAAGLDDRGQLVDITPRWTASDPTMVELSSDLGALLTLVVRRAGQSSLRVDFQGITRMLHFKAASRNNAMQVEISQKQ